MSIILQYFFFFLFKEWIVPVMMQRCGSSYSLLRNENAEDFRHSWLETYNHGVLELERRGGGEEISQLLSIDSIFECTEKNFVIYPSEYRIWFDGYIVFSWYFVTIKVTSARISTGLMDFFLHKYAALVYEGRWPQIGSTYRSFSRKSSEAQIFIINRRISYVVMYSHLAWESLDSKRESSWDRLYYCLLGFSNEGFLFLLWFTYWACSLKSLNSISFP